MRATENTQARTRTTATTTPTVGDRIGATVMASFFAASALIGLWSFAALVGGLVAGGGPLGLAEGYFRAVTGM